MGPCQGRSENNFELVGDFGLDDPFQHGVFHFMTFCTETL